MPTSRQNSRGPQLVNTFRRQRLVHHTAAVASIMWAIAFVVAAYRLPPELDQALAQPINLAGTLMFGITILVPIIISTEASAKMKRAATALGIPNA